MKSKYMNLRILDILAFPYFRQQKLEKVKEPSTVEGELMSHEQLKQKEEYDKMMAIANAHKKRVRGLLAELTAEYNKLIKTSVLFFILFLYMFYLMFSDNKIQL